MTDENELPDIPANHVPAGDLPTDRRPLGYWLRAVDALLTRQFDAAFAAENITRREWMLLNLVAGDVDAPGWAERLARKGKRLRRLEDLGWAEEQGDGTWALTDAGRDAHQRLGDIVNGIRSRVAGAVSPEDYATTMASLEAIARELGWDEGDPFPGGRGRGRGWGGRFGGPRPFRPEIRFGFGPNLHHGFEPGRPGRPGTDPHHGTSHEDSWGGHGHGDPGCRGHHHGRHGHGRHGFPHHGDHEHGHHGHGSEQAYERGFDAGFARGQESGAA
ncbi:hypothetical protein ASD56_04175 [Microbacterium sp. Root166]|uniref:MarR family winged helix-turn-helix transcriptional regulator n=1 Tax=Microbacterium sp. Root166 TaxID=1736478 RepID=UPI0006FE14AE|nr:hypothetical protein [Microbacterium sp. Root166]KQZ85527.1 hypothetical protein ASD56_04175 [Microbacterium sp. Root166]